MVEEGMGHHDRKQVRTLGWWLTFEEMLQIKTETSGLTYSRLKGWTARVDKMVNDFKSKTEGCALRQLVIENH